MNIEKEREAFESAIQELSGGQAKNDVNPVTGDYQYGVMQVMWSVWQAAKAQAVPKYHMENIRDALVIACDIKEDEGRFEDSLNYIHQAMIEAQEQNQ